MPGKYVVLDADRVNCRQGRCRWDSAGSIFPARCRRSHVVTAPARITSSTHKFPTASYYPRPGLLPWGPADTHRPPADAGARDSNPEPADSRTAVSVGC